MSVLLEDRHRHTRLNRPGRAKARKGSRHAHLEAPRPAAPIDRPRPRSRARRRRVRRERGGTITGNLSETSQVNAGQGDTFLGMWRCDGTHMTGHDYRFVDSDPRKLSRTDWDATFTPADGGTLTIHFEFARVLETATAADARTAPILFDDDIVAIRIATP